jgi:hypothetical protein
MNVLPVNGGDKGRGKAVGNGSIDDVAFRFEAVNPLAARIQFIEVIYEGIEDRGRLDNNPVLFPEELEKFWRFWKKAEGHKHSYFLELLGFKLRQVFGGFHITVGLKKKQARAKFKFQSRLSLT